MKTITTFAALLTGGLTAATGTAHAGQAQAPAARTVAVHYGDLDLGSSNGRAALDQRIRQAVRAACGTASPADLKGMNAAAACRRDLHATLAAPRDAAFAAATRPATPAVRVARR